jgi:hypothetical protein
MARIILRSVVEVVNAAVAASRKARLFYDQYINPTGSSFL